MKDVNASVNLDKLQTKIFCLMQLISLDLIFSEISKSRFLKMKVDFGMV